LRFEIRVATTNDEACALFIDEQYIYQTALMETEYGKPL